MAQDRSVQQARQRAEAPPSSLPLPRQIRSRAKLDRLLVAGAQLFGERGFDGTRISDVAELAGCSVGIIYQRFTDKDAFFAAVRTRWIEQAMARLEQRIEANPGSPTLQQSLRFFVHESISLFRENHDLLHTFLIYEANHPESSAPMIEFAHAITDRRAKQLLEHELGAGHPDPDLAFRFALEVLRATLVYLVLHSTEAPLTLNDERFPREIERMLVAYLTAG